MTSRLTTLGIAVLVLAAFLAGCGDAAEIPAESLSQASSSSNNVVEVVSNGMNFDIPDEVPSGWTTFRYHNRSDATHFIQIGKLPVFEGSQITVEDARATVVPAFQALMDSINTHDMTPMEAFGAVAGAFPAWFLEAGYTYVGGPGLIAPGRTAETTVYLAPGAYTIECYAKMADGTFHSALGMLEGFTVTEEASGAEEPGEVTLEVVLSSEDGIEVEGPLSPGEHTVAVHFEDQKVYGHFLGHDLHLARLDDDTDLEALAAWMNWAAPEGLTTDPVTPAPAEFLGGVQDMTAGATGYLTVLLEPGRYAWISEVPDPAGKGMLKTFTVSSGRTAGK